MFRLAEGQQAGKIPRIGFLTTGAGGKCQSFFWSLPSRFTRVRLHEGKNINIEYRHAEGRLERLPELAEELVHLKVDILVVSGATVARPARKATATIPIVMAGSGNPIGSDLVASLARPGGNVTGLYQYPQSCLERDSNC
jgi:putative tryptophan/tyrosine transport system substrate-binding protein